MDVLIVKQENGAMPLLSPESSDKSDGNLVVKSNRLVEASYKLSMVEQQIILYAICKSREEQKGLTSDTPVVIKAAEFAAMFNMNEKSVYAQLKTAITSLYGRSVGIRCIDNDSGKTMVIDHRWISRKAYIDGAGRVQIIFASDIIPYITRLGETGEFTSYRLKYISKMSSVHAVRLYELLIQYKTIGRRDFGLDELRAMLCLTTEYASIKDFKKYVIDIAIEQINAHTDMKVSYEQKKSGRVITNLIFAIQMKPKGQVRQTVFKPARQPKAIAPRSVNDDLRASAGDGVKVSFGFGSKRR